ncbi:MAG: DNA repair protein RecO [Actinomycetia bacterium]|nr:DNA repair protein RecO [Actinomycetes bacterium]
MPVRSLSTEAVILRALRYGEADLILHVFTLERGRMGAIAKGARRTQSRFGARIEPFSHAELRLHLGRGDLATLTGVELLRSHERLRGSYGCMATAQVAAESVLRMFLEGDASPRAFEALVRFLDVLEEAGAAADGPATDPLVLSFGLKLLWVAGFLPHLDGCASCGAPEPLEAFSVSAGGGVCSACQNGAQPLSAAAIDGMLSLLRRPLAEARAVGLTSSTVREILWVVEQIHSYHCGFRLRTLAQR